MPSRRTERARTVGSLAGTGREAAWPEDLKKWGSVQIHGGQFYGRLTPTCTSGREGAGGGPEGAEAKRTP